jgi:hypothetical protein
MIAYSANVSLPYHNSFENAAVDKKFDEGNGKGLDVNDNPAANCSAYVRNDYPARHGKNYLEFSCFYDADGRRDDAVRVDMTFEGYQNGGYKGSSMRIDDGTEYWISWSNYIPQDYPANYYSHQIAQITDPSEKNNGWRILWALRYGGDSQHGRDDWDGRFDPGTGNRGPTYSQNWSRDKGKWTDWVLHIVWYSSDNPKARWELYKDGAKVFSHNGKKNTYPGAMPFLTPGNLYQSEYRSRNQQPSSKYIRWFDKDHTRSTYFDEFRFLEGNIGKYDYCDASPPITPAQPNITTPANGQKDLPTDFSVTFSGYTDSIADKKNCFAFKKSQVQIDEVGGNWSTPVYDSGEINAERSHRVSGLSPSKRYQIRVRHKSQRKESNDTFWGDWSKPVTFTTVSPVSGRKLSPPQKIKATLL